MTDVQDPRLAALLAEMARDIKHTAEGVDRVEGKVDGLKQEYVSIEKFNNLAEKVTLLQRIVFGIVGMAALSVAGALFKLVIIPGGAGG